MSLNKVTLILDLYDGSDYPINTGTAVFVPSAVLTDASDHVLVTQRPVTAGFGTSSPSVQLVATDNSSITQTGWAWTVTFTGMPAPPPSFSFLLPYTSGSTATQYLSDLVPAQPVTQMAAYLPLPSGTATSGQVPVATGSGSASAWGTVSGSGVSPPAGDIGGTAGSPTVVATHLSAALPLAQGGTAATTQQAAVNSLTGTQAAGHYLRSDGTNASLAAIQAADVPTLNQSTTGTAAGLSSTLAVTSGGTGQATQQAALNAIAGAVTSGDYLRGSGTNVSMSAIQAADVPTLNQNTTGSAGSANALNSATTTVGVSAATAPVSGQVLTATSGTAATWQNPASGFANPMTTTGDIIAENSVPAPARIAGNTTATKNFLTQTGTGSASALPAWGTIAAGDVPVLNQNTTGTAGGLSATLPVAQGGTGDASLTAYGVLAGGTTSTGALQQVSGTGSSTQVLTSNGAGALPTWQAATGGMANPMTTLGDGIYGGASGAPSRMPGNTTAQTMAMVQTGTGSTSAAPGWAVVSGQFLAMGQYAPSSQTLLTVTGTSYAQISASINTGAFTAPPSGQVMVNVSLVCELSAAGQFGIGLALHGTTTMVGQQVTRANAVSVPAPYMTNFMVTGLTPGTTYNLDLMGCAGSATLTVMAQGQTTASPSLAGGNESGPVTLSVQAI